MCYLIRSFISYQYFFLIHSMKVKTKDGQKMDKGVKILKSNIWPNVQEIIDLHIKVLLWNCNLPV